MRATALISTVAMGVLALAPSRAANICTAPCVAYAADNGGGPAGPNFAQMDLPVTAHVGSLCSVVFSGNPPGGADFGDTVDLGDIADANGHLLSSLNTSSASSAVIDESFQVNCSGVANAFTLTATPLATSVAAPAGYANTVNYTAEVDFLTTGAGVSFAHASDSVTQDQNFAAGVGLANTANDVRIKAYNFNTAHTSSDILVASPQYQGIITVTISAGT